MTQEKIIGYIHICQVEGWKRSYDLIFDSVKKSGLYDATEEIRIGIVNDTGKVIPDERFNDEKINIIYVGRCRQYERPTLLHMREQSEYESCKYWYMHTKGIRHFGKSNERNIINWINLLLYWVVSKWKGAVNVLDTHDTYGCLYIARGQFEPHYSGNFWWATSKYVKTLSRTIDKEYISPETYILTRKPKYFNAYTNKFLCLYYLEINPNEYNTLEVTTNQGVLAHEELENNVKSPTDFTPQHLVTINLPKLPPEKITNPPRRLINFKYIRR